MKWQTILKNQDLLSLFVILNLSYRFLMPVSPVTYATSVDYDKKYGKKTEKNA